MELMVSSREGLELIRSFEGCRVVAYKAVPSERYWTIGYGHYGKDVKSGQRITIDEAEALLRKDVRPIEEVLNGLRINFKQNQFDALVSWIYNLGIGNFSKSTMKSYIVKDMSDELITGQMVKWYNSGGKPLLGLKRRRVSEANYWLGYKGYVIDEETKEIKFTGKS